MKPAPFEYVRPGSLAEACELLAGDEDARIIAGGQTLVPMLAMRLARPTKLVDILRLPELRGIRREAIQSRSVRSPVRSRSSAAKPFAANCRC
jgi:CO/xanthine dehydrogenase FAD-binding subunit